MLRVALGLLFIGVIGCSTKATHERRLSPPPSKPTVDTDENLWLEEVQGERALKWVDERNRQTLGGIQNLSSYKTNDAEIRQILFAKDRIPAVTLMGGHLYNFWQDETHVRGLWRRTSVDSYRSKDPEWETVIDVDELARREKENWVWKGVDCYEPKLTRCLIFLSRGGKDASVVREFGLDGKEFVSDGFDLPEAKSSVAWVDEDQLLVATDFGSGSLTKSGYARIAKLWKRGEPLSGAKTILEIGDDDLGVALKSLVAPEGQLSLVMRDVDFYRNEAFQLTKSGNLKRIEKPLDAVVNAWFKSKLILQLRSDWIVDGEAFKAGSLVALPLNEAQRPQLVFAPTPLQSIESVSSVKGALILGYLDSVKGRVGRILYKRHRWHMENLPFPASGSLTVTSAESLGDKILVNFRGFLTPSTVFMARVLGQGPASTIEPDPLKILPSRFDENRFEVEQLFARSRDGTQVPYFLIRAKNMKADGSNPVLIDGYGGFEVSQTPYYLGLVGKVWLEKGGSYVVANIRGGGEFGPAWHQAAIKENRQKAFDDFIAVAEDLIQRKISSPEKMAITGGSNGGLLVAATFVQRPDLYKAVICEVPLLDMLRYNKLLAGASWEGEYGDPADPAMREAILKYSPYQNVKADVKYPEVFFMTSTADDRVHPGHARKMAARMLAQGHTVQYFENTEGGHGGAANLEQTVRMQALTYTFLQDRLIR